MVYPEYITYVPYEPMYLLSLWIDIHNSAGVMRKIKMYPNILNIFLKQKSIYDTYSWFL